MAGQRPRFYRGSVDLKDEDEAIIPLPLCAHWAFYCPESHVTW